MHLAYPLIVVYLLTALLTGTVAWLSIRQRGLPGAFWFGVSMIAVAVWVAISAGSQHPLFHGQLVFSFLLRIVWVPIGVLGIAWLAFGLSYSGRDEALTRFRLVGLSVVPAVTVLVGQTHPVLLDHYAAWLGPFGGAVEPLRALSPAWDTVSLLGRVYTYLLGGCGSVLLLQMIRERPSFDAGQVLLFFVVAPPWLLNVVQLLTDLQAFNPTLLGFAVSGVAGLFAVTRLRLFDTSLARARIVEDLDSGVVVYGQNGNIYDYNERAAELLELPAEPTGADIRDTLSASQLHVQVPSDATLFSGREPTENQSRPTAVEDRVGENAVGDGGEVTLRSHLHERTVAVDEDSTADRYVEIRLSTFSTDASDPTSGALRLLDVTTREQRKRALERSRDRYEMLFENTPQILWELDLSAVKARVDDLAATVGNLAAYLDDNKQELRQITDEIEILEVNQNAVEYYGANSKAELLEQTDRIATDDTWGMTGEFCAAIADGEARFRSETVIETFDGNRRPVIVDIYVPRSHADGYDRAYLAATDITERREREQELQRKNELLDEFASVVSHDVATPLGVIENKAQLIELTGDTDHVDDIHAASEQVRELIDRLRALAAAGSDIGDTEPVDLATVARDAWVTVPSHDATLSIDAEIAVEADRNRLRQALENLFENAVEHGSTSPLAPGDSGQPQSDDAPAVSTTVGTFEEGFYVADDGPGIPAPDREAIFEQGYSTDSEGTGIGLSIVRRIVEAHGWRIEVTDSDAGGARFEFWTDE
jgi:signal transduction histidine kinase